MFITPFHHHVTLFLILYTRSGVWALFSDRTPTRVRASVFHVQWMYRRLRTITSWPSPAIPSDLRSPTASSLVIFV